MSTAKKKGTAAETDVVRYLRAAGFPSTERRAQTGNHDRGDITGIPGTVIEVKNCARTELASWVDEAETEGRNDQAHVAVVWHKRRGRSNPADWFVTMTGDQFTWLLRAAMGLPEAEEALAEEFGGGEAA
ncbi:hypothetical protein [Streptomyces syringium]|uniref:hypothetical protein n=1 Tax=Streptomyces syringium TaxID=76729 RepID=UPI003AB0EAB4